MPPRKASKKGPSRYVEQEADEEEDVSVDSSSEEERGETSEVTLRAEEEDEEEEVEENSDTVGVKGKKRRRRTEAGTNKAEMKKWRRLAIEEKEAITNQGGLVWRATQPLLASLSTKQKRDISNTVRSILDSVEQRLDKVLMPRTTHMPHASRNLASGSALSSTGSILGSVMSWQVERGGKMLEDEDEDKEQDEVSVLELGGFSSDIALLETLLLPEATETVAMSRAVEEQERELESSKAQLIELKADRERRRKEEDKTGSELQARLNRAKELLQRTGAPMLNRAEGMALREAALAL